MFSRTSLICIFLPACLLCALSLIMLVSIAQTKVLTQALFVVLSLLVGWGIYRVGSNNLFFFVKPLYVMLIVLLITTVVFGHVARGSARWIEIAGVRGQVSELAKPILLLVGVSFLKKPWSVRRKTQIFQLFFFIICMGIPVFLVLLQPDLGTGVVLSVIAVTLLFFSGVPRWMLLTAFVLILGAVPFSRSLLADYQVRRIESFINPLADPKGSGYQVIQSTIAVGSGQVFGRGLGHGTQSRLRFLPERQTDFMFASLVEELGLLGGVLTLILYVTIIAYLFHSAVHSKERTDFLLLMGCACWLFFQTVTNITMNLGLAPVTGITLPFLSAGGSSLVSSGMMLALAASSLKTKH